MTIVGTDGSGKTTVADAVAHQLNERGIASARVWLGAESLILRPARMMLGRILRQKMRSGSQRDGNGTDPIAHSTYSAEVARKQSLAARHPLAVRAYVRLAMADYRIQTWFKLRKHRHLDVVVADRYLFDVAVNIGLAVGWSPERVVRFVHSELSLYPIPMVRVFLQADPEVSLARKSDIPDSEYLELRLVYYNALACSFGFSKRDGCLPVARNAEWLADEVVRVFGRRHVHYVHSNNEDVGGADKVLALMATHMMNAPEPECDPCNVTVSLRAHTPAVFAYRDAGIPAIVYPFARPQVSGRIRSVVAFVFRAPRSFWRLRLVLRRLDPDVVHVNDLYDALPALAARSSGVPVVHHVRMIKSNWILRSVFGAILRHIPNVTISVSEAVRYHYFGEDPPATARVVHDLGNERLVSSDRPVRDVGPRPEGVDGTGRFVVMVGRIEPWKGQLIFVDAVSALEPVLRASNVFALVGRGVAQKEDYATCVTVRAERQGIVMLGERDDIPAILAAADISVHCSTSPDPFPGVVIESLLAGAATIATAGGGVLEMIDSNSVGTLIPPGDPSALTSELERLLTCSEGPRTIYGPAARAKGLELVDSRTIDLAIHRIYSDLHLVPRQRLDAVSKHSSQQKGQSTDDLS